MARDQVSAASRIAAVAARWAVRQPLLAAIWAMHRMEPMPDGTIRVGGRLIRYNPDFIDQLTTEQLGDLMVFEAVRIALGHTSARIRDDAHLTGVASNLAVQECLHLNVPVPPAAEVFDDPGLAGQTMERYYAVLSARQQEDEPEDDPAPSDDANGSGEVDGDESQNDGAAVEGDGDSLDRHFRSAGELVRDWRDDPLLKERIDAAVSRIETDADWGSIGATGQSRLRAGTPPRLSRGDVIRRFRASVQSDRRTLTRTRPNRRYGWSQFGTIRTPSVRLLMGLDVSGSISDEEAARGLSLTARLLRADLSRIDLLCFDDQLRGRPISLRRGRSELAVIGRGSTRFEPLLNYAAGRGSVSGATGGTLDAPRNRTVYDGVVIFTDGVAPTPNLHDDVRSRLPPVLWIINNAVNEAACRSKLRSIGELVHVIG